MGGQLKKSTKKYEKNHLKDEIQRRRSVKKVKQRYQVAEKKKARRKQDREPEEGAAGVSVSGVAGSNGAASLKDMSMDDFFQGGFEFEASAKAPKSKKRKRATSQSQSKETDSADESLSGSARDSDDNSVDEHKQDLEALAEKDPDFYRYLQENDSELLDFNVPAPPSDSEDDIEADEDAGAESQQDVRADNTIKVTLELVRQWNDALKTGHSLSALKELVLAFRAAAQTETDDEVELKYSIHSADVFHEILIVALREVPAVLEHHYPIQEAANGRVVVPANAKKQRPSAALLNVHFASIVQMLETITDPKTLKVTLSSLMPMLPYVLALKKPLRNLMRSIVGTWSDASADESVRINAFLLIRRLTVIADSPTREAVLKTVYQGLVRGSRKTTVHTLAAINLMKNSAVELWGIDGDIGYTTGFGYIRQLALHLRNTITQPTKDSHRAIYNWQYVHSLDFWSRVLAAHCSPETNIAIKKPADSALHPLLYPLVQITLGAIRLLCTPAYFPLRFHLTQALLRISRTTHTYIPLAPLLLEVLQSPVLRSPPHPATLRPLEFHAILHAPKPYLKTRVYQDGLGEQVIFCLAEFFGVWAKSIAFPELIVPPSFFLRRWLKEVAHPAKKPLHRNVKAKSQGNANNKLNASIRLFLQKLDANAAFVERHRDKVDFAVSDRANVEAFLRDVPWTETPLGAYVAGLRQQRQDREKVLEQGRLERNANGDDGREDEDEQLDEEEDGAEEDDEMGMEADEKPDDI